MGLYELRIGKFVRSNFEKMEKVMGVQAICWVDKAICWVHKAICWVHKAIVRRVLRSIFRPNLGSPLVQNNMKRLVDIKRDRRIA